MMNDREALIALNAVSGLGAGMIHRFLSALPSVEEAFGLSPAAVREILDRWATPAVVEGMRRAADGKGLAGELAEAGRLGVRIVTLFDPDYPAILKQITDPPPVL
ncbi:MAG: hypothetical protein HYZ93_04620, partial [Candidatus Omnitrophica bacterium]|nr:hypothetical protein [Candidatus Omnitrophota bacterium]